MKKILLFLSKTDDELYESCPQSAKNTQLAYGLFVLLTGVLAFISGTYAISNLFIDYDWQHNTTEFQDEGLLISISLGVLYAIMIMAIDREVVSARNKGAAFSRLFLAMAIGTVVAVPI
ncbi:MAG: DUF4407 domain-containing protein, partial [Flavobacteriaceae bacterium]